MSVGSLAKHALLGLGEGAGDARIHHLSILVRMNHCLPTHELPRPFSLL